MPRHIETAMRWAFDDSRLGHSWASLNEEFETQHPQCHEQNSPGCVAGAALPAHSATQFVVDVARKRAPQLSPAVSEDFNQRLEELVAALKRDEKLASSKELTDKDALAWVGGKVFQMLEKGKDPGSPADFNGDG